MASSDGIDTSTAVGKYLFRQTTGVRLNADGNTATENQAVLESIAIAFLLNPQAALSLILRTKNTLQQLIAADIELVDYLVDAIGEISNPDTPVSSTSDLVDAQTALLELDRIGRVGTELQAYSRYTASITKFMNQQLAVSLKRHAKGTFERTGTEAKSDLFSGLNLFTKTHALVSTRTQQLAAAVTDYRSVDLTKIVTAATLSRVRTSLDRIKSGMDQSNISKATAAIELLAGAASLTSISNALDPYDHTIETDVIPSGRTITIGPEPTHAVVVGDVGPFQLPIGPSHTLRFTKGVNYDVPLPIGSRFGCPYLPANKVDVGGNISIPASRYLYVNITPGPAPGPDGATLFYVPLTPGGVVPVATTQADINTVLGVNGHCDLLSSRFVISGSSSDTAIEVLSCGPGSFDALTSVWTPDPISAHETLGFIQQLIGYPQEYYTSEYLADLVNASTASTVVVADVVDQAPRFTSVSEDPEDTFTLANFPVELGFTASPLTVVPVPKALLLTEDVTLDPSVLGVLVGSVVRATVFTQAVTEIDGNRLLFDTPSVVLPLSSSSVIVDAPVVQIMQSLMTLLSQYVSTFDQDLVPLQQVLSPLLSTPTLAQVNDALRVFATIRAKLVGLSDSLNTVSLRADQQPAASVASSILSTLEERGMDRAQALLAQSLFSQFFALTDQGSSKGSQFLKTMEDVGRNELSTSTIESEQPQGNLVAGTNSVSLLTDKNVP